MNIITSFGARINQRRRARRNEAITVAILLGLSKDQRSYRLSMAKTIENSDNLYGNRAEQVQNFLRTGQSLWVLDWQCPDACGFKHGHYTAKMGSPMHNAPICACGVIMEPEPGEGGLPLPYSKYRSDYAKKNPLAYPQATAKYDAKRAALR